jgi:hypothetical protein
MSRGFATLACCLLLAGQAQAGLMFGPGGPGAVGGRSLYLAELTRQATQRGVPPALADAVAMIETGYRPDALGASGEIGLMQILPSTALQLGFHGTLAELFAPATNIRLGVEYLARAWALSGGNTCRALMKYRAGLGQEVMTPLSQLYCARATFWLAGLGSPLAQGAGLPQGLAPPPPAADPYVIAVIPALAAQAKLPPVLATAHEQIPNYHYHRSMAQRSAALQERFDAHLRHYGLQSAARPQAPDADEDDGN